MNLQASDKLEPTVEAIIHSIVICRLISGFLPKLPITALLLQERKDDSLMQSELEDEAVSDDNTLESDDALLKQSELEDEILSNKPSGSVERDNDSLKHSGLEAESPSCAAAAEVKLVKEDCQLGTKEVVNIIFEERNNNVVINLPTMALALN